ncbi:WD repeat domain 43 [Seminavis robusta]|uniref:WD repeat domain 43 n=1 Tax=Seminavis robusta TaxID=568900 RepID=A0A9N8HZL9_9STRA|nr:WD repeat domain 43 [Seminavis robusta]|eukprot:Sro2322_g323270.1 WD repeat domain 43 (565) ;mRNA; f:7037-8731
MSSSPQLLASQSHDGSLVAVAVLPMTSRLTIQIYQVETRALKTTLTTGKAKTVARICFCGNDHVIVQTTDQSVLIWDLKRGGVVAHEITCDSDKSILTVTCHDSRIYLLVGVGASNNTNQKLQVHQYDPTSGRLLRKVKVGKREGPVVGLAVHQQSFLVRNGSPKEAFRVLNAETGAKLEKYKYKQKGGPGGIYTCRNLVVLPTLTSIALFDWNTKQWLEPLPGGKGPVRLWEQDQQVHIVVGSQAVYRFSSGKAELISKIQCHHPVALLPGSRDDMTAVLHNPTAKGGSLQVQTVEYNNNDDDKLTIQWQEPTKDMDDKDNNKTAKRSKESMVVLGPGQAGTESTTVSEGTQPRNKKRKISGDDSSNKKDDDEDMEEEDDNEGDKEAHDDDPTETIGVSIADRLEQLTRVMEEEDALDDMVDFNRHAPDGRIITHKENFGQTATTESLSELLTQALQGGNDGLLELALGVQDTQILQQTVEGLSDQSLNTLLTKLTTRLASKPLRVAELIVWFRAIVQTGRIRDPAQLLPLKNLVQERVSYFPQMLQLEGRLNSLKGLHLLDR